MFYALIYLLCFSNYLAVSNCCPLLEGFIPHYLTWFLMKTSTLLMVASSAMALSLLASVGFFVSSSFAQENMTTATNETGGMMGNQTNQTGGKFHSGGSKASMKRGTYSMVVRLFYGSTLQNLQAA
jgi:hypothetical protein